MPPSEIVDSTLEIDRARRREKENRLRDFPSQTNMIILFIKIRIVIADVRNLQSIILSKQSKFMKMKTRNNKQQFFVVENLKVRLRIFVLA